MGLMSSLGKRPSRLQGSMMGTTSFSMNLRVESRTRRSSSESRESNSIKSTPLNFNAIRLVPYECERSAQTRTPVERKLLMVIEGGREGQWKDARAVSSKSCTTSGLSTSRRLYRTFQVCDQIPAT